MDTKRVSRFLTLVVLAVSIACATTTFDSTWKDPEAQPIRLTGQKVAAVFISRNPNVRRRAEDALAREITARGARGVPSYTLLSGEQVRDRDAAKTVFEQQGFAGAVVMRVTGSETQYTYQPGFYAGPRYRHFWGGYWGWGWGSVYEPGYLTADRVVSVETLVYSLEQDRLIWAAHSRTVDPQRIGDFVSELAAAVSKQMLSDGVFARGGVRSSAIRSSGARPQV
ncbi:MAG: hypothetical protein M3S32_02610 [Acidobacteriota bacterium]|nr:hypothetical protein [Acidobacteriota bacterium]